jgi:hypothetical protein
MTMRILLLLAALLASTAAAQTKIKTHNITDGAVTTAKLAADSVTTGKIVNGAVGTADLEDGGVAAADLAASLDLSGKTLTLPAANTPAFTKNYTSTTQTITAAGTITLAHSLGGMPMLVVLRLRCTTAELGYSIGDEVVVDYAESNSADRGAAVTVDSTNIVLRYGANANTFVVLNKTTGVAAGITNASWAVIVYAWR